MKCDIVMKKKNSKNKNNYGVFISFVGAFMIKAIFRALKAQMKIKNMLLWFALGFVGSLLVFIYFMDRTIDNALVIEAFGFGIVLVMLMIGTKAYSIFVDGYWQGFVDKADERGERKAKEKQTKKKIKYKGRR